ncbi:MAG: hypothetical protein HUU01_09870 [Saprospiraceae bacterium]|nr:hypothetical protein [Saprospiraceae bacterium]
MPNRYRYPGAKPFQTDQQDIFFGRINDAETLFQLTSLERLVVLYSKSGLGKSSLINAGLIPRIHQMGQVTPIQIRFGAWMPGRADTPIHITAERISTGFSEPDWLEKLVPGDISLWRHAKSRQISDPAFGNFLLIFDQFEELFTYPREVVLEFKKQLGELIYTQIPQRYRDAVEEQISDLNDEILEALHLHMNGQVLLAIRSDRMHLLDRLSDYLPTILSNCYELGPMDSRQATSAIEHPALAEGDFASPPFRYEKPALDAILDFLTEKGAEKIESFQLQILCQSVEQTVIKKQLHSVGIHDLGDLNAIYENYYDDQISSIEDPDEQQAARKLIEDELIFEDEERRLSLYEGIIVHKIKPETLRQLVDHHLLRAEPSAQGGYTYELSHDTLVPPVLKSKARRKTEEAREAEEKARAIRETELLSLRQKAEEEHRKRRAARRLAFVAMIAAGISILASVSALWLYRQAAFAKEQAEIARKQAEANEQRAKRNLVKYEEEAKSRKKLEVKELLESAKVYYDAGYKDLAARTLNQALEIDSSDEVRNQVMAIQKKIGPR